MFQQYSSVLEICPVNEPDPPDGEILYIYPGYTEFRQMVPPVENEVCPVLANTFRNRARLEQIDLEHHANELLPGEENDPESIAATNRVDSRLYISQSFDVNGGSEKSKRGVITCVSAKSARRLQKKMSRANLDLWIDLTFSDDVLSHLPFADRMRVSYECLNEFERVIKGMGLHYIWKKEIEPRKSGDFIGVRVSHYHVGLCGLSQDQKNNWRWLCIELLMKWVKITGTENPKAMSVALKIKDGTPQSYRLIENSKMAIRYIGKYFSKTSAVSGREEGSEKESIGRAWGCSRDLPLAPAQVVHLSPDESIKIRRFVRRYLKPKKNKKFIGLLEQLKNGYDTFAFIVDDVILAFVGFCDVVPF